VTPRTLNRLKLLGIGAIALAPVVGSYLLYAFWTPQEHINHGVLLEARALPAVQLALVDGKPFDFEQLRGRWVLVMIAGGACPRACEDKLWTIRQVRQAQGKDLQRIERVWLIDDNEMPAARLAQDYAGTWFVRTQPSPILDAFVADGSNRDHIYLVDPLGNVMMRFPQAPEPKRMIKDLGRLLKYSGIG
jgi:hypothetical protein